MQFSCSNNKSGTSMQSEAIRRLRSCRERSNGIRTMSPPATGRAVRTACAWAETLSRNASAGPSKSGLIATMAETSEVRGNRRRSCHDAKQLHDDAQAGALVPAPCGEGARERGRRIARRLAVAVEGNTGRQ